MIISVAITMFMSTISGVWAFVIECGAGLGLILILRWFWWRINAISEIVATVTPFIVYGVLYFGKVDVKFPETLFIIVPITTLAWIVTVLITKPTEESKLCLLQTSPPARLRKFLQCCLDVKPDRAMHFYLQIGYWALFCLHVSFGIGK
jgi:hypothetical protein